jgi:hypothetical protein
LVNDRDISADGLKLDAHTHNGTDSQRVKHSDLTLDGGTNPHKTTAADVGALSNKGGTVSGSLSIVVPQLQDQIIEALVLGPTNASNLRLGYHQDYSLIQSHGSKPLLINGPGNNVGIGSTKNPVAKLDIASATRTGTHPTAVKGLYITGDFKDDSDGVEFRHTNGTQGIGFGSNTIYAAGSNANQDLGLKAKGTGEVKVTGNLSVTGSLSFGSSMRQMLNLYGTVHAIGVQNNTKYFRTSGNFAWYKGGSHNDAAFNAGTNGTSLMTLDVSGNLSVLGTISPAGTETNKDLGLKAKGTGKVKIDSSAIITGKVGIGTTDPKAILDVNGSVKFAGNSTIVSRMICGQVFYNTSTSKWQYSTFAEGVNIVKMSESHFKISYGFTVKWTQQLMILATTFEERADHTACVRQIHKDHCVICIINTKDQYQKAQNFSFMIIHYDSPPNSSYFSDVRNESGVVTTAPVNPYYYTP